MADGKPKRSLFKRPTWAADTTPAAAAAAAASTSPDPTSNAEPPADLFSHSHNYSDFVQDRQRQRREKSDKDAQRRSQTTEQVKLQDPRAGKRTRLSNDKDTELAESVRPESYAIAPTPRKPRPRQETVIELLDASDDDGSVHATPPSSPQTLDPTPAAEPDPDPDADLDAVYYSDPEMREYARKAREKRRQQEREQSESGGTHDPTFKLLITSPIPNTTPLIVSRKLSQNLQAVREAWISKQPLDPTILSRIFFTFKLRRLYDVTTVRSLGIKLDSWGRIINSNRLFFTDNDDEHAEKIHIEAVTEETWQDLKDKKAAPKPNKYLSNAVTAEKQGDSTEGTPAVDGESTIQEPLIKITLKAKGHSDIKIKVRPSTTIGKMINAARRSFKLDADRLLHLEFDGERLEPPEGLVKDTDISDMDCIEVHIK